MAKTQEPQGEHMAAPFRFAPLRPLRFERAAPCRTNCPSGTPVRDWIAAIAQHQDPATADEALAAAWRLLVEYNPFPATMGRICPHPCETDCNRGDKEGAVAIHQLERYLGDWALSRNRALPLLPGDPQPEHVGVIGAGPAGLSYAYQMRRRGYAVTVYDNHEQPGGMLRYGIPEYRLPRPILDSEIARILATGVRLISNVRVGSDPDLQTLQRRHAVLFLGLGAQLGRRLGLVGEDLGGVWTGTGFLERHNRGLRPQVGEHVIVVGGGNTAIDAARVARRYGARVTLVYRRAREDMPAIVEEIQAACEEGVVLETWLAPLALRRDDAGTLTGLLVQRMSPGPPDATGRAVPVPVPGDTWTIAASSLITAISQAPDWAGLEAIAPGGSWLPFDASGNRHLDGGGDVTGLHLASHAIGQARLVAERTHAELRGIELSPGQTAHDDPAAINPDYYPSLARVVTQRLSVRERLEEPGSEISQTMNAGQFRQEISRCFSCGLCNGCRQCWMYCGAQSFTPLPQAAPGRYFAFALDACEGCGKCIELCPTGFLSAGG